MRAVRCHERGLRVLDSVDRFEHGRVVGRGPQVRLARTHPMALRRRVLRDLRHPVPERLPLPHPARVIAVRDPLHGGEDLAGVTAAGPQLAEHGLHLEVERVVLEEALGHGISLVGVAGAGAVPLRRS